MEGGTDQKDPAYQGHEVIAFFRRQEAMVHKGSAGHMKGEENLTLVMKKRQRQRSRMSTA